MSRSKPYRFVSGDGPRGGPEPPSWATIMVLAVAPVLLVLAASFPSVVTVFAVGFGLGVVTAGKAIPLARSSLSAP